jgi:general secretion pathway protein K
LRRERGFIVVAVLWMLGALAALASVYAVYVINTATGLSVNDDRLKADALTRAALELTAYRINSIDPEIRPSSGDFLFTLGRANVSVVFRSEAARIDLNLASRELLAGLFTGLGASPANAGFYADRIIAWRTPRDPEAQTDEPAAYRTAGLTYAPRQSSFASVGELPLVLGLPPALVERALPFVTVFSGRAEINILDAAPEVVAALPGMTPDRLYAVLSQRGRGPEAAKFLLNLIGPDQANATIEPGKTARITLRIDLENGRRVQAEAVILLLDDAEEPFRVLSWRDDLDGST